MTRLSVADDVLQQFPGLTVAAVAATGLKADGPWPQTNRRLAELERSVQEGDWEPADEDDPRIQEWHVVYRAFGTNPRRRRPSVEALCRRLARSGRLPRINAPVDTYNLVSVVHVFPLGAYDLDRVKGPITIRRAHTDDTFIPLGQPDVVEHPRPDEVVYADANGTLTRDWNHHDADHTKVTPDSTTVLFLLETPRAERRASPPGAQSQLAPLDDPHVIPLPAARIERRRAVAGMINE